MDARIIAAEGIYNATSSGVLFPWDTLDDKSREHMGIMADGALTALQMSGYAITKLPEPDSDRYTGDEHEPADRPSWEVDTYEVAVWTPGEVQINYDGSLGDLLDTAVARDFAGALLAAVERAES